MPLVGSTINPQEISSIEAGYGYATLFVTDYHVLAAHSWILNVVNDNQQCYTAHIVSDMGVGSTARFLDGTFSDYVRSCCSSLGCDAIVEYIVDDKVVMTKKYGWDDGAYGMTFKVYCKPDVLNLLASQLANASNDAPLIVITSDPSSDWGFAVHKSMGSHDVTKDAHDFLYNR